MSVLNLYLPTPPKTNHERLKQTWPASWCRHPNGPRNQTAVFLFRRTITFTEKPEKFVVHVSADQRYRFYVNGKSVVWGPARGDLTHWQYETVDLAPYLEPGENVLAVRVHYLGETLSPVAQMSFEASLLVCGDTDSEAQINTPGKWRVCCDESYSFSSADADALKTYCVVGPSETMDCARQPWGWETQEFNASAWPRAVSVKSAQPYGIENAETYWWLVPRSIPFMEESPQRFARVARADGTETPEGWPASPNVPLIIPAGTRATLLLDQGYETCAFPELTVSGGTGSVLRLTYAEALVTGEENLSHSRQKGNRDEVEGRILRGYGDTWKLDGTERRLLRPLWWKTFRYAELTIETGDVPVTLHDVQSTYTGYPFVEKATFVAPEIADLKDLWTTGWRTARLCAHETYMDCPYYEQLQYVGDTRIQCLVTLYTSGDARLFRNALSHFDASRTPDGLTQSRYPARIPQIISPFSLWYVGMVHDYWRHVPGDEDFVRGLLPGIRGVLEWFRLRFADNGLLGPLDWWNFVDWSREWKMGVPPGARDGGSSIVTLQYVLAVQYAADLESSLGRPETAQTLRGELRPVLVALRNLCFDAETGRVADTPERKSFSQHAAILAILAGLCVDKAQETAVMERILSDTDLTQATFYFRFYLNRALVKAGMGDRYLDTLGPWRDMKTLGLTTWAEEPEPTRSDCHAWSAAPNYEFLATVLGVTPDAPGFARVRIAPHVGKLTQVSGIVPHPRGEIHVSFTVVGDALEADISLPDVVTGTLVWRGAELPLGSGRTKTRVGN